MGLRQTDGLQSRGTQFSGIRALHQSAGLRAATRSTSSLRFLLLSLITFFIMSSVDVYEDNSKLEKEEAGRSQSPDPYIYVPGTPEEAKLVKKIDWVSFGLPGCGACLSLAIHSSYLPHSVCYRSCELCNSLWLIFAVTCALFCRSTDQALFSDG